MHLIDGSTWMERTGERKEVCGQLECNRITDSLSFSLGRIVDHVLSLTFFFLVFFLENQF